MRTHVALLGTLACLSCVPDPEFPEVGAWTMSGPGGPNMSFQDTDLYEPCAVLSGGPEDAQEHNLVGMLDGYLLMPWAPEDAGGGISFYDFSDPCAPEEVGKAVLPSMRETHTLATGWVDGRRFLAVDSMDPEDTSVGGVGFVDITDPAAPFWVSEIALPEFNYPDAYFFVTLSAFWLGDVLYVPMGFAGVVVLDVSDVTAPKHVATLPPDTLLTGSFHVIGNRAMLSNAGMTLTRFYDVSDPLMPVPVPGGEWSVTDGDGRQIPYYFANMGGKYALFARKGDGGGPVVFDVSRPDAPTFVGHLHQPDAAGGYIFRHHDHLFQGEVTMVPCTPWRTRRKSRSGTIFVAGGFGYGHTCRQCGCGECGPWRAGKYKHHGGPVADRLRCKGAYCGTSLSGRWGRVCWRTERSGYFL